MMPSPTIKLGKQSGEHGSYSFYRSFSYLTAKKWRHVKLGKFFFVRLGKDSPICVGELQLVWTGRHSNHPLTSVRLYYLPEQLPDGRQSHHGQDELVATDKMVLHAKDLINWIICDGVEWSLGLSLVTNSNHSNTNESTETSASTISSCSKCRKNSKTDGLSCNVQIIDSTTYCKLRTALKRAAGKLDFRQIVNNPHLSALYDLKNIKPANYIMFCKERFECPELENHDYRCDHLAPNLKGRPRKKAKGKQAAAKIRHSKVSSMSNSAAASSTSTEQQNASSSTPDENEKQKEAERYEKVIRQILSNKEQFNKTLFKHMKDVGTPISKIPSLGFKKVDLHSLFKHVYSSGGYKEICRKRLWKTIYDKLGGNPHNTSAPSCTKKQYERLLLSFERNIVLPGTAGKIKIPHMTLSEPAQQRKPKLKTRLDKIRQEWSSLVKYEKPQQLVENDEKAVATVSAKWQTSARIPSLSQQEKCNKDGLPLVIDDEAFDEDQLPLAMLSSLKSKQKENAATSTNSLPSDIISQSAATTCASTTTVSRTTARTATSTWIVPSGLPSSTAHTDTKLTETTPVLVNDESESTCAKDGNLFTKPPSAVLPPTILPAHGVLKAPMPLNVLGPCHPDQLTFAQRSPWKIRLSTRYGSPKEIMEYNHVKRAACDEVLDLSAKKMKMEPEEASKSELTVDECGAIDLTMSSNKPLDLIKAKQSSDYTSPTENWKPQDEPINYSKVKGAPTVSVPLNQPAPLVHKQVVHGLVSDRQDMAPYQPNYSAFHKPKMPMSKITAAAVPSAPQTPILYPSPINNIRMASAEQLVNSKVPSHLYRTNVQILTPQPLALNRNSSQNSDRPHRVEQPTATNVKQQQKDTNFQMDLSSHVDPSWRTGNPNSASTSLPITTPTNTSHTNVTRSGNPPDREHQLQTNHQQTSPSTRLLGPNFTDHRHRGIHGHLDQPPPPPKYTDYHHRIEPSYKPSKAAGHHNSNSGLSTVSNRISESNSKMESDTFPTVLSRFNDKSSLVRSRQMPPVHATPKSSSQSILSSSHPTASHQSSVHRMPSQISLGQRPTAQQLPPPLNLHNQQMVSSRGQQLQSQSQSSLGQEILTQQISDSQRLKPVLPEQRLPSYVPSRSELKSQIAGQSKMSDRMHHHLHKTGQLIQQPLKVPEQHVKQPVHSPPQHMAHPMHSPGQLNKQVLNNSGGRRVSSSMHSPIQQMKQPTLSPGQHLAQSVHIPGQQMKQPLRSPSQRMSLSVHKPEQQIKQHVHSPGQRMLQPMNSPGKRQAQSLHSPGQRTLQPLHSPEQLRQQSVNNNIRQRMQQHLRSPEHPHKSGHSPRPRIPAQNASDHPEIQPEQRSLTQTVPATRYSGLGVHPSQLSPHQARLVNTAPTISMAHMQPVLQRLPTNANIQAMSLPYEYFMPNYQLPAPPRLQPIPSRHNSSSSSSLQPRQRINNP